MFGSVDITWYSNRESIEFSEFLKSSKKAYSYAVFRHFQVWLYGQSLLCFWFAWFPGPQL
nr:MAG TPA: hypothetical protein [Caudoviricetes sp.]